MNRITDPRKERYTSPTQTGWKKLQQLEDIEQELGIDLVTLFKALKRGIYVKDLDNIQFVALKVNQLTNKYFLTNDNIVHNSLYVLFLFNYGKTWALTEEELLDE